MNLDTSKWKPFKLGALFDIKKGKRLTSEEQEDGNNNYVGAIDSNNGIANHISQNPIHKGNTISLSYNGSVGEAFYQKDDYWATDDVNALYSKYERFNQSIGLFFVAVIRQEKYKFSYGRKWTLENMKSTIIFLPVQHNADGSEYIDSEHKYSEDGYVPDWEFMERYIQSLHYKPLTTKNKVGQAPDLRVSEWKPFTINKLFNVQLAKGDIKYDDVEKGEIPLVSAGESNNGIIGYIDSKADGKSIIFNKNAITVDMFGNAFYQQKDFFAVSHGRVNILVPYFKLNTDIGIFISALIKQEQYKYSYGRAVYSSVLSAMTISLPVQHNADGSEYIDSEHKYSEDGYVPDWEFMERYIQSLPYGDRL